MSLSASVASSVCAGVYPANFTQKIVASGLISPSGMDVAADGRIFIGEQKGRIHVVRNDTLLVPPVLNLQPKLDYNTERGLQGIVLDPDFAVNGYIYVYYTAKFPASHNRLSRFTVVNNVADTALETVLFEVPNLPARLSFTSINVPGTTTQAVWHMGGGLVFGNDGKIYLGIGDHEVTANGQDLSVVFGKIVRLNPDGGIPADNPFYATATGQARAIYAYGFRHPYSLAIQRASGRIYVNDVGESTWEEIDTLVAGGNYGWGACEGLYNLGSTSALCSNVAAVKPFFSYRHGTTTSTGNCVIGGGFSHNFRAQDNGKYFFGDFTNTTTATHGWIKSVNPLTGGDTATFATGVSNITNLRFGPGGALYFLSRGYPTGTIDTVGTTSKISRLYKVSYDLAVGVRESGAQASIPGLRPGLLALGASLSLTVPTGAVGVEIFDLKGSRLWRAHALKRGDVLALPASLPRGVLKYRWIARTGSGEDRF